MEVLGNAEQTEALLSITPTLQSISEHRLSLTLSTITILSVIVASSSILTILGQLKGEDNLELSEGRVVNDSLDNACRLSAFGLIYLARINLDQLSIRAEHKFCVQSLKVQEILEVCTRDCLKDWSQNLILGA